MEVSPLYFQCAIRRPFQTFIGVAREVVQPTFDRPTHLVGTGLSGALVIPMAAFCTKLHWWLIRKGGEHTHHSGMVSGTDTHTKGHVRYIIVDDFISTGKTVRGIMESMSTYSLKMGMMSVTPVGIVLYERRSGDYQLTPEGLKDLEEDLKVPIRVVKPSEEEAEELASEIYWKTRYGMDQWQH